MKKNKNEIWILIIGYVVFLTILISVASSCSPQRKLYSLEHKHPELLLQYCASNAITDTVILPGRLQVDTQTVVLSCDTVFQTDTLKWNVVKKVPIYTHVPDTIVANIVDTSGKALLRNENSRITDENNTLEGKLSAWQFWAILGWVVVIAAAVGIGFSFKLKLP